MAEAIPPPMTASDTGLPSNVAAGICAIFHLLGGIVFYFIETKDLFVRHWAIQSIFFGGGWIGAFLAISIFSGILSHLPGIGLIFALLFGLVYFVVWIGGIILWVIGIVQALLGQRWEYPVVSRLGKRYFPNLC
ncbi:MAG: DUF4870 domain-containing protein [Verrucomicrobia bacterium]|nr:DUF4870 domain-containing protein [Verrucomicrobiota bacterium]